MKCVAAKHNGTQMTQSSSHFTIGYNVSVLNNRVTGVMIMG